MYRLAERIASRLKYRMPHFLRNAVNLMHYDPKVCCFNSRHVDYVVMDGCKFLPSDQLTSLVRPVGPWFEGTKPDDVVLDIGAGIGSVAIPLAKRVKWVSAIEPLYHEQLKANIELNDLKDIGIAKMALSNECKEIEVSYGSLTSKVTADTFQSFLRTRNYSFLKIDIEGAEWDIDPSEVLGIREIRIEFHIRRGKAREDRRKILYWVGILEANGYYVKLYPGLHESSLQFKTVDYFLASKERTEWPEKLFP